mmetsp:Transcript_21088/g.23479  ORF Transcript_21088/g.23479 Transcript_21088/m.23479 type:complete len:111 (+) Transcript_21088:38-370(+)
MDQINLKEVLKRKNYGDSAEKIRWSNKVLFDNYQTSKESNKVLEQSRKSRRSLERSLESTRGVINKYNDYKDEYSQAINRLKVRIEKDDIERKTETSTQESNKSINSYQD